MTRWRVTAKVPNVHGGRRIATDKYWETARAAQKYADETNEYRPGARARVVKDSERVRGMIP